MWMVIVIGMIFVSIFLIGIGLNPIFPLIGLLGSLFVWSVTLLREVDKRQEREFQAASEYAKQVIEEWFRQREARLNTALNIHSAYRLMGLNEATSDREVKKRYNELAMKWHPDRWATSSEENQEIAKRNFQKVNEAYKTIQNFRLQTQPK